MILEECLSSILSQSHTSFVIIFVDNNSSNDSVSFVEKNFSDPRIKIIRSEKNLGFAGRNNWRLKQANGEFIVLLNNETVVNKDWLKHLYKLIISDDTISIVQSLVINEGILAK